MRNRLLSLSLFLVLLWSMIPPVFATGASHTLSQDGLAFIQQFETFQAKAYSSNGTWFIGYGTPCGEGDYPEGISQETAQALLKEALAPSVKSVNAYLAQHKLTVKQHEFDALVSFTYSLGSSWMDPSYRISQYLIAGLGDVEHTEIVDSMAVWCHVQSQVHQEQLDRRIDEGRLLLYGDYGSSGSQDYYALILNANGGTVVNDTVCYQGGQIYQLLPEASRENYKFEGWYLENGDKLTPDRMVSGHLTVTAKWAPTASLSFRDVQNSDWFFPYVYDLYQQGIINGHSADEFAPNGNVTLAQALKLTLLAAGHEKQAPSAAHWASGYLDFAVSKGFLAAGNQKLDAPSSRLEIARLAAKSLGLPDSSTATPFADTSDGAVLALYDLGIIEGSYEGSTLVFKPDSNITRAELSAIIWRMAQAEPPSQPQPDPKPEPEPTPEPKPEPKPEPGKQIAYNGQMLDVIPGVPVYAYSNSNFYKSNGFTLYRTDEYVCKTGVDVSVYQGNIDWKKVKASGVDFAIIRVGGRGWGQDGNVYADRTFQQNIEGAIAAGLDVGVYFFSQAITVEEAREEARFTLDAVKGYDLTYPVVFDWERIGGSETRTYGLATETLCAAANAFCSMVEDAGYKPMIYFNSYAGYVKYDLSKIMDYEFWFAQYENVPNFYYNFQMWQYTSSGTVDGIPGKVDLNLYWTKP